MSNVCKRSRWRTALTVNAVQGIPVRDRNKLDRGLDYAAWDSPTSWSVCSL